MAWACSYENLFAHNYSTSGANSVGFAGAIRIEVSSYCYNCFGGKSDGQVLDLLRIRTAGAAQLA